MAEAVFRDDLVVREVDSPVHMQQAVINGVFRVDGAAAKLATTEVCDERPSIVTVNARSVLLHHLLESLGEHLPVALEIVGAFEVHLGAPSLPVCDHQVDQTGLVISLALASVGKCFGEELADLVTNCAFRAHGRPSVEHVHGPLAVPDQEHAGVES